MKNNKFLTLFLLFIFCGFGSLEAQDKSTMVSVQGRELSLSDCIELAQKNSPQLLSLQPQVDMLGLDYQASKEAFLPSVNASVGENVSFGRSPNKNQVYQDVSSANTSFQIGGELTIFSGGARWYQLQKTKAALENSDYIVSETMDNIALQVASSYIQLLLAQEMAMTAKENLTLTEQYYEQVKEQVRLGKVAFSQQIEIESQMGRDQLAVVETQADVSRAKRSLLLDMGVTSETDLEIEQVSPETVVASLKKATPHNMNHEWILPRTALLQRDLELSVYDVKIAKSRYIPSISLNGGYSNSYYYNFGDGFKGVNPDFGDQLKHNGRSYIGVSLNIPIYNKGQVRNQIKQAKLQQLRLQGQLIQQQYSDRRNIVLAEADLLKAEEQYRVSKENLQLSQKALDIADLEYRAGRISTYEWEQARNRKLQAQASYLQSIYTRLLRTINLTYFNTGEIPVDLTN